jgi:glycosyltransferase involved in cell wall biosynthesis
VRVDEFLQSVQGFKQSGGRLVWTVHNAMPHEVRFEEVELYLRNELAMQADLIHVMCDATLGEVGDVYRLPEERTVVIPHSGYVGVYPDAVDRDTARTNLGLDPGDIALLALGGIRPYKRLDWLLDALDRALDLEPRLRLIVAGKPGRFPGLRDLQERCDSHPAVIANFNEIASHDLQHFYKAADVAVLTHGAAMNSGALFLAYSFGCPVIAPRLGCLAETLVESASIGFDPTDFNSLVDALASAERVSNMDARRAARSFAESRPVADMSGAFLKELDRLER